MKTLLKVSPLFAAALLVSGTAALKHFTDKAIINFNNQADEPTILDFDPEDKFL